ncbi:hypothetical protein SAMN05428961_1174 [Paenibacillus sp. OK060]|uniref:hypothetical protein n=1 Tax=Paenibacillus sp. OK060 TaxID=1881034 RepID=UPI000885798D|nr:hypothetical protein [Paenibacillus sp. OK060]SDM41610.1 hypothetical protein SAMN05428961_1174 [Paenibacillus sp. OK060]
MKYTTVLLTATIVLGSFSTLSVTADSNQMGRQVSQISAKSTVVNKSTYQSVSKFKKNVSSTTITWSGKNVTLTANTSERENVPTFERTVIDSIVLTQGEKTYTLETDNYEDKLLDITSVAASESNSWLAIQAHRSSGNTLILMDLKTGKTTNLNDRLLEEGKKNIETVSSYNWSPKSEQIAFAFGDTEKSSLAIYNPNDDTFVYLPRATNYISTGIILWQKNGTILDYICEYPSDNMILYRYNLESKKVKPVKKISKNEFKEWFKLDKYPTK